ncbi:uncharacterized protein LOC112350914 [Selaginella moellendorffii]|uniref:uncharacterized protein LOC112350914 n=1 Tax=Selaginella moellendorffii TaxID=88036 RepID=UPI000D1C6C9E|nr:uncharacterized protein LOC112350914 [Selaginella moellendorffii]|eukprot:XP_024543725.1 uncharacterized protein LOC112350914 [Selaginella moellendorffii]
MSVVEVAMRDKRLKVFMIDTAMSWIGQKYSTELSAEFKLPNMKYKGDSVQKQYIRAGPKGPLISEIPDVEAELEPSFPLLAKKDQLKADTLGSKQQGSFRQADAPSSNVQSEVKAVHLVTETIQNERSTLPRVLENNAETDDPATLATMSFVSEEDIARTARKVAEENTGVDSSRLITSTPSKVEEQQTKPEVYEERPVPSADFLEKPQLPAIQTEYLGRPVEYIFLHISFPQEANLENLQVCSSNTEVYVEIPNYEAMRVPLMFPVSSENAEAELSPDNAVVTLKLPYLGVKGLYCCGNR